MIVPEKTIAYLPIKTPILLDIDINKFLKPLNLDHKRDWFNPHFYKCLPLSIGNMQGFAFSCPFDFEVFWNGGNLIEDVMIFSEKEITENLEKRNYVDVSSEFGSGIFTVHFPLILKTPPKVNLMTIAPPNYPVPGISPMTGVIETDNLRFTFTLNFKIDIPNVRIKIKKDYPIMGILPIPRYYCDSFNLINAEDIFSKEEIEEEQEVQDENSRLRNYNNKNNLGADKLYYQGKDVRKNKFKNHQLPKRSKE